MNIFESLNYCISEGQNVLSSIRNIFLDLQLASSNSYMKSDDTFPPMRFCKQKRNLIKLQLSAQKQN